MKRILIVIGLLVIFSSLILAGLSCSKDVEVTAEISKKFTLPVGQTAVITGEGLTLKFVKVESDSRCAKGVECIWAGEVKCQVRVNYHGAISDIVMIESGNSTLSLGTLGNYNVVFEVEPYPEAGQTIADSDYKLIMTVAK